VALGGSEPIVDDLKALTDALLAAVKRLEEGYRKVCLEAGNANTRVYQVLKDEGPLHFYELVLKTKMSRSTVHRALVGIT
jgi:hypothetical protein